jgi:hypothetical protein
MYTLGAFLTALNPNKRDRDLASRDLLHQLVGCQVGKIVPTYVVDRNDRLAVYCAMSRNAVFATTARIITMARPGLVAIALLPKNVLRPIKAADLKYWKRRYVSARDLVTIAWEKDGPS